MEENDVPYLVGVQRPSMPHTLDSTVHIELEDYICALFSREIVPLAHVREIIEEPHIFSIWHTLPRDVKTLMGHVVGALMVI